MSDLSALTMTDGTRESDARLAARLRSGDRQALGVLFTRHAENLFRLAWRLTASRADAEDVVQDVFLGLATALQRYEEREALLPWLRRLTARRALMQRRSGARATARELAAAGQQPAVAREEERLPTALVLSDAIAALPDSLREVFVLSDVEGFAHAEIALMLGITEQASRTRRRRAVVQLQNALRTSR